MDRRTAKREAEKAGLALYWSTEWRSWGLVDPGARVESEWMSSGELATMGAGAFSARIDEVLARLAAIA